MVEQLCGAGVPVLMMLIDYARAKRTTDIDEHRITRYLGNRPGRDE